MYKYIQNFCIIRTLQCFNLSPVILMAEFF